MSSSSNNKRKPWERQERQYCQYCNVWMGSDRQSILLHENGQKHQAAVDKYMLDKRAAKLQQEKSASVIQKSLAQMEAAAQQAQANDYPYYYNTHPTAAVHYPPPPQPLSSSSLSIPPPPPPVSLGQDPSVLPSQRQEKKQWEDRKKHRQEDNQKKKKRGDDSDDGGEEDDNNPPLSSSLKRVKIDPEIGHYRANEMTWLEGDVLGEGIVEEDMPVQLWTGSILASSTEKRLVERDMHWKDALIVSVRRRKQRQQQSASSSSLENDEEDQVLVDLAYLESPDAVQETLVQSVPLHRIRIRLGNPQDDRIPETLEEARLLAMGGEVVATEQPPSAVVAAAIDEATGLSSWTTVSVKRTTVRQELKEERARLRQKRKEAALEAERQAKQAEERKMEEAKVANADDSALGAYDVWNRGAKEGYKGIDIHGEAKVEVHELGKKLADGKAVEFKKPAFKAKAKKQNRRTTSADD